MRIWLVAAAVAASLRSIQLVVSLWPLPLGAWLIAAAMQAGLVAIVWLAVHAIRRAAWAATWGRQGSSPARRMSVPPVA
jgi:hypothetical protein